MVVFCDECGERYIIENNEIKEKVVIINCTICHNLIKISLPDRDVKNRPGSRITRG
jgi:DNA-directed RNA polymerase subunit M/transcription elongation factor TFIIS